MTDMSSSLPAEGAMALASPEASYGIANFWAQADGVIQAVTLLLLIMSIMSWTQIALRVDRSEFLTRAMRQSIVRSSAKLESGLTALASIGTIAPFVGLFGTVWGIYHALLGIASAGSASIDKISGPVGEALIMTAAGLFVAIPAALAYNAFVRFNRVELAELDGFAHDLHAYLNTGARLASRPSIHVVEPSK
jgi:biopolymer transport protein ExbB/TolQ